MSLHTKANGVFISSGLVALSLAWLLVACEPDQTQEQSSAPRPESDVALLKKAQINFQGPLPEVAKAPEHNPTTPEKIQLGKMLFYDTRLSQSGNISCNSCHNLKSYGVDNLPQSPGHQGQKGHRNSPTVLNASFHVAQFWDGRAADLETQAGGPILNPIEMAIPNETTLIQSLTNIPAYQTAFAAAFPDEPQAVNFKNVTRALASFERSLITPSRFDQFLSGQTQALTAQEKLGLQLFLNHGCVACHSGPNIGGAMFQKFGLVAPYPHQKDRGRAEVTKNVRDEYFFKVPSLRNVAKTQPYFHDGKVQELPEAVKIMGQIQLGKELPEHEINSIVAFLKSLTGEVPQEALEAPHF